MKRCGEQISFHRKRLNMTQTELGEKLNVTAQAVSKWENGISEPDLSSVQRLCRIFGISVDELLGGGEDESETTSETAAGDASAEQAPAAQPVQAAVLQAQPAPAEEQPSAPAQPAPKIIVGYCARCKRPIEQGEDYQVVQGRGPQRIYCPACREANAHDVNLSNYREEQTAFRRSMIWGSVVAGVLALLFLILPLAMQNYALFAGLILAVAGFTFTSQCFWGEFMSDFFLFFVKSFRMPGLIFSLDLDGIIWFITVKLLLMILSGILSVILFLIGVFLSLIVSVFSFPISLPVELHKLKKLRKEAGGSSAK